MSTELRHLRIVVVAADAGSFSAAARALNMDVSVVSRIVRDLELSIGIEIFERLPRGVRLTTAGAAYVDSARDIIVRVARAGEVASLAAAGNIGRLAVGFVWSFSSGPVVKLLRSFCIAYPGVSVRTVEDGNEELITRLRAQNLDLALAATDPPAYPRLKSIGSLNSLELWLELLCVAVPDTVQADVITWSLVAEQHLLCRPKDDWRRFVAHVERVGGPTLRFSVQDVSHEGLLGLAAAGLGWVIVPARHLDEMYVKLNGEMVYLWRAVDHEGEVLESFVTRTRDKAAALTFMKKALKRHGSPEAITTDGLRSYKAAMTELGCTEKQEIGRWANNRVENSHLPFRRRERAMSRFRRMKTLQKFASVHASMHNHFSQERHLIDRKTYKTRRSAALAEWQNLMA